MKYGLIGEKLGHSFSKEIHENISDESYELKEISSDELEQFILSKEYSGLNVTIPYKEKVIPFLDDISPRAKMIGAVNTIVNKDGFLYGDNTDFMGLRELILKNDFNFENATVLILGSGGTSKTARAVAQDLNAKIIKRVSRTIKADENDIITYEEAIKNYSNVDFIINTTPVGMYPKTDFSPIDISNFNSLSGVIDAVYNPLRTKLTLDCLTKNISAVNGLYMLAAQAVYASALFRNVEVDVSLIDKAYNNVLAGIRNIVLIGMPSSGKSTIGQILADKTNMVLQECDNLIKLKAGKSIPQIFEEDGENTFRNIEKEIIAEVSVNQNSIISTGGGAVLNSVNVENLKRNGIIIFLDRDLENLIATNDRPLSSDKSRLKQLYNERYELYRNAADIIIDANGDATVVAEGILQQLYGKEPK